MSEPRADQLGNVEATDENALLIDPSGLLKELQRTVASSAGVKSQAEKGGGEGSSVLPDLTIGGVEPPHSVAPRTEAKIPALDAVALERAVEAVYDALDGINNTEPVYEILKGRNQAERQRMNVIYEQKYGRSMADEFEEELSGSALSQAMNLLHARDGVPDRAGQIYTAYLKCSEAPADSRIMCERDVRDTLAVMSSAEIAKLEKEFKSRYFLDMRTLLVDLSSFSETGKEAIGVYLKGTDRRTDADTRQLAELALEKEDIQLFQEIFRQGSRAVRDEYLTEEGWEKVDDAFSGDNLKIAEDFLRFGSLTTATKILVASGLDDNEDAVERAIAEMTKEERAAYARGRDLQKAWDAEQQAPSTPEDSLAFARYTMVRAALEDLGSSDEIARWEDMIFNKGGGLVSMLGEMDGANDDELGVYRAIEDLDKENWERLKDPATGSDYRQRIQDRLADFLDDDELSAAMGLLDKKLAARTYEEASSNNRPILQALSQVLRDSIDSYTGNVSEEDVYKAIARMPKDDQLRYAQDASFRQSVDEMVKTLLDGTEEDVAFSMLSGVARGESPMGDAGQSLITQLWTHAAESNTDEAQVIRDLQRAFAESEKRAELHGAGSPDGVGAAPAAAQPTLRDRINNPKNPADVVFATEFRTALHRALDDDEYEKYARPLLETGHLPIDLQMELNQALTGDDELGTYSDILNASKEEKERILADADYRQKVLGFLSENERALALNVLTQGEMCAEDTVRAHVLGAGTGENEIKQVLSDLSPDDVIRVKNEYARKYGVDLTWHLIDELGGQDKIDAERAVRTEAASAVEAFDRARAEYYVSRGGQDHTLDNTGALADNALHAFAGEVANNPESMTFERRTQLTENLQESLDVYRASKESSADKIIDGTLLVASLLAAPFSGGGSLAFLFRCGVAGAVFKVGAKSRMMGGDYDWAASGAIDAATGFMDGATAGLGSGHIARLMGPGRTPLFLTASSGAASLTARSVTRALPNWDSHRDFGDNLAMVGEVAATSAPLGAVGNVGTFFAPTVAQVGWRFTSKKVVSLLRKPK